MLCHTLKLLKASLDDLFQGGKSFTNLLFGNIKYGLLCLIQEFVRLLPTLEATLGNNRTLIDQLPSYRELPHNLRMILDASRGGDGIHKGSQKLCTTRLFQEIFSSEELGECDEIDGLIVGIEINHPFEQVRMGFTVKIVGRQDIHDLVHGIVVNQNTGQYGLFSVHVVRRDFYRRWSLLLFWLKHFGT